MAITGASLGTNFGINSAVCLVALAIFSILRVNSFTRKFYAPKRFDPEVKLKPRRLPMGLFSWIGPVLFYPEDEVLRVAGMDVIVMVRLLAYGWALFAFCTFWCCALLMPINGTGGFLATQEPGSFSDLDLLSASNIPPSGPRSHSFWAHLFSVYLVSFVAMLLLLAFSRDISRLRARYISTLPRGGTSHCVLVTDIPCVDGVGMDGSSSQKILKKVAPAAPQMAAHGKPVELQPSEGYVAVDDAVLDPWADARTNLAAGSAPSMVRHEMEATYGAQRINAVNMVRDTRKLEPLLKKYEVTKRKLEDLNDDYIGKLRRKQPIKRKQIGVNPVTAPKWAKERFGVSGTKSVKVDSLEYLPLELDHIYSQMKEERDNVGEAYLPAAFVTFNDRFAANTAATGLHSYDETAWRVVPAPGPDEVLWQNVHMRYKTRTLRTIAMWALFIAILVLYIPVTAAIQAVVNLDNARKVPGLSVITRIPFVTQVLQGILPGLVLTIFLAILPPILGLMARFEGKISVSEVDFSIVSRFFIFQVFATFIYQFLIGGIMGNISGIIADPSGQIVKILGVSAVQTSSFFMSFIMIKALGCGLGLLRIVPLVLFFAFSKLAGTERAKYRLWAKQPFMFGSNVAMHSMILLLGLAFTCLAPLIAPFCLLYFTLALLAQKYQLTYVVTLSYDAAGRMWGNVFHQIMVGVYFLQLMALALLLVKTFPYALLLLPLLVLTACFHVVVGKLFRRPWALMNAKEAAVLDARDHSPIVGAEAEAVQAKYLSPVFKVDEAAHAALLVEAASVDARIKGDEAALRLEDAEAGGDVEAA